MKSINEVEIARMRSVASDCAIANEGPKKNDASTVITQKEEITNDSSEPR